MDSAQFIEWLERKLNDAGVAKVIPDQEALEKAYRRAWRRAKVQEAIDRALLEPEDDLVIPCDLDRTIHDRIEGTDTPWDLAVWDVVREQRDDDPA